MIAIIKTGGKQYKIEEGDIITVEKIEGESGTKITFDEVLFIGDEKEVKVGEELKGAKVEAEIVDQLRAKKITTIKHRPKKRYLKKIGHKQHLTQVEILKFVK
jgi:large subunit ribosomal protein L21